LEELRWAPLRSFDIQARAVCPANEAVSIGPRRFNASGFRRAEVHAPRGVPWNL